MPPLSAVGISGLQAGEDVNYYLPSVSRASGQVEAVDALAWWRKFLSDRMPVAP